jgi:hypothetical protein
VWFGVTCTLGVNDEMPEGVWLTLIGSDQLKPPSVERERTTSA